MIENEVEEKRYIFQLLRVYPPYVVEDVSFALCTYVYLNSRHK